MISVCLASYNGYKYIKEQLLSILRQLSTEDEVVISDDGSNDETIDVIRSIDDCRIKIFENKNKHGYTGNFENALRNVSGDIIVLSDQDDVWVDNKIEVIVDALKNYDFVVSDAKIVDQNLNVISDSFFSLRRPYFNKWGDWLKCGYLGCCMSFNKNVLNKALPFPSNHNLCAHDYWLMLIGSFFFKVKYEKEPLVLYRRHGSNVSDAGMSKGVSIAEKIIYRLYVLFCLLMRKYGK